MILKNKITYQQYDLAVLYKNDLAYSSLLEGDCGILVVYAEEQTGFKDKITFEFTGSNLDKKDLFSESDPFFTISRSGLKS